MDTGNPKVADRAAQTIPREIVQDRMDDRQYAKLSKSAVAVVWS